MTTIRCDTVQCAGLVLPLADNPIIFPPPGNIATMMMMVMMMMMKIVSDLWLSGNTVSCPWQWRHSSLTGEHSPHGDADGEDDDLHMGI